MASRELRFSAPLEMGRMVLGLNQDTIFQSCICPGPGPPADKCCACGFLLQGLHCQSSTSFTGSISGLSPCQVLSQRVLPTARVAEEPEAQRD